MGDEREGLRLEHFDCPRLECGRQKVELQAQAERRITELEAALDKAVDFILGAGLTPEGKAKWREGLNPQEQVDRAIAYTDGMIAT